MGITLVFLYILFSTSFPQDIWLTLAPYRLPFWMGTVGLVIGGAALLGKGARFARLPQLWALLALTVIMCVSTVVAERWAGATMVVLSHFSGAITTFLLIIWHVDSVKRIRLVAAAFVLAIIGLCVQGLYSYATGWDSWRVLCIYADAENTERIDSDEAYEQIKADLVKHGNEKAVGELYGMARAAAVNEGRVGTRVRGNGVLQDPNDFAQAVLAALPFLWLVAKKGKWLRNLVFVAAPTVLMIVTLYYTKSRGGALGLLAVLAILFGRRMGALKAFALIAVLGLVMSAAHFTGGRAISSDDESSEGRLAAWSEGLQMFSSNPVLGVGFNRFTEYNLLTAHNSYVLSFSETGFAGYFCWLAILIATVLQLSALKKTPGIDELSEGIRRWAGALQVSICAFLVTGFFLSRTFVFIPYMLVAMGCALVLIAQKNNLPFALPKPGNIFKLTLTVEFSSMILIYMLVRVGRLLG